MSTKPSADPSMERGANPVRPAPAPAPAPRKPAPLPQKKSGFQRFVLQFLLLVIALGGAYGTGYLVNANEMQTNRNDLLQQQLDAQERILALEQQIAELRETRERGNRVELDLTEVFDPIRDAVGRIALARMGEISREITTELTRLVEDDLARLDDPASAAAGGAGPGGMSNGDPAADPTSEPEVATSVVEPPAPQSGGGRPDSLQPDSSAFDAARPPDPATEIAGNEPETAEPPPAARPASAGSVPAPANEASAAGGADLPPAARQAVSQEASRSAPAAGGGFGAGPGAPSPPGRSARAADAPETARPPGPGGAIPGTVP